MLSEILQQLRTLLRNDDGRVSIIEYALTLGLIAIAVSTFIVGLSGEVTSVFSPTISSLAQSS